MLGGHRNKSQTGRSLPENGGNLMRRWYSRSSLQRPWRNLASVIGGLCLLIAVPVLADGLPITRPDRVGLSQERLDRIDVVMKDHVEKGHIPGALGMIARRGQVAYFSTWGQRDREAGKPMTPDTIFRIYSMSKPITSVAAMILFEEGRYSLNDPVKKFLPELAELEVKSEEKDPATGVTTVRISKAHRDITIRDLLRHTAGFTYGFFGDTEVDRAYRERGILREQKDLGELLTQLGKLPLRFEPGTRWHYSLSVDVLGRLIEVVSGKTFDRFLDERLFEPLGMNDTAFWVAPEKMDRLAQMYSPKGSQFGTDAFLRAKGGIQELVPSDRQASRDFVAKPGLMSGGGGLVSTANDYLRFSQMMLNGGQLDGRRILSRKTVELMTTDHLGDMPGMMSRGYGFGLGFAVARDVGQIGDLGSVGEYNWGGAAGTRFWIDPQEQLIGIYMIQIIPHTGLEYGTEFKRLVYQAIAD
jgi:CubicO group peptidase (beta-lactamase class C family)